MKFPGNALLSVDVYGMLDVMYFGQVIAGVGNESTTAAAAACKEGDNTTSKTKEVKIAVQSANEGSTAAESTSEVMADTTYSERIPPKWHINEQVWVKDLGKWYKAKILAIHRGRAKVHFLGWGKNFDQWVELWELNKY